MMKALKMLLLVSLFLGCALTAEEEPDAATKPQLQVLELQARDEAVESILQMNKANPAANKPITPLVLNSMEEAHKHFARDSMEYLGSAVDFEKQQVAVFVWHGYKSDRLAGYIDKKAVFHLGRDRNPSPRHTHCRVFAIPKGLEIDVLLEFFGVSGALPEK